jgi:hypothetical protein
MARRTVDGTPDSSARRSPPEPIGNLPERRPSAPNPGDAALFPCVGPRWSLRGAALRREKPSIRRLLSAIQWTDVHFRGVFHRPQLIGQGWWSSCKIAREIDRS